MAFDHKGVTYRIQPQSPGVMEWSIVSKPDGLESAASTGRGPSWRAAHKEARAAIDRHNKGQVVRKAG